MIKLEEQVCSPELALKLKEKGVSQHSHFYWHALHGQYRLRTWLPDISGEMSYSAYMIGELMHMLQAMIDTQKNEPFNNFWFHLQKRSATNIQYVVNYVCDTYTAEQYAVGSERRLFSHNIYDEKLADALAKTLLALIDKGYVSA